MTLQHLTAKVLPESITLLKDWVFAEYRSIVIAFRQGTFFEARQCSVGCTTNTGWRRSLREIRIEFLRTTGSTSNTFQSPGKGVWLKYSCDSPLVQAAESVTGFDRANRRPRFVDHVWE